MLQLQDILERLRNGQSIKSIRRELGKHKTVIRQVKKIAEKHGWLDMGHSLPTEKELREAYDESTGMEEGETHPLDRCRDDIDRWVNRGVSKQPRLIFFLNNLFPRCHITS